MIRRIVVILVLLVGICTAPVAGHAIERAGAVLPAGAAQFDVDPALNARAQMAAEHLPGAFTAAMSNEQFGSAFAGDKITSTGLEVSLVSAGNTSAQAAALPSSIDGVPLSIRYVKNSEAQLRDLTSRIGQDRGRWLAQGITLSEWGPEYDSNKVHVALAQRTDGAAATLLKYYGSDWINVDQQSSTFAKSSGRTTDTSPWYGADFIYRSGVNCTSNFTFIGKSNGLAYTGTAGHCGVGVWSTNGQTLGIVGSIWYGNQDVDFEDIRVTSRATLPYIWADPNEYTRRVTSYATTDPVGGLICTDGAADREVCNVRIYYTYQTDCYDNQCTYDTVDATQLNGHGAFSPGDSGGPVETALSSTTTEARGVIDSYRVGQTSRGNYTPIRFVLALGFTLQTG